MGSEILQKPNFPRNSTKKQYHLASKFKYTGLALLYAQVSMTLILQSGKRRQGELQDPIPYHKVRMFINSTQGTLPPNRQKSLAGRWQGRGKGEKAERGMVRKQNGRYIPQQQPSGINHTSNLLQLSPPPPFF